MRNSVIKQLKRKVNIVDVASNYLHLHRVGQNYFAHCPFHTDTTPSFCVSESRQIFKCFSCGRSGDVITLIKDLEHVGFVTAMKRLASLAGVSTKHLGLHAKRIPHYHFTNAQQAWFSIYDHVARIYHHVLTGTQAGDNGLAYLKRRGITKADIENFGLGYVPKDHISATRALVNGTVKTVTGTYLPNYNYCNIANRTDLLCGKRNQYVRFMNRITIPIRNRFGHTVAFSGRALGHPQYEPKYLNSPDNAFFKREQALFNIDHAVRDSRTASTLFLCEGFMDVIAIYDAGYHNVVSSFGTSLTAGQIKRLARLTKRIVICYDGDRPGQIATDKAVNNIARYSDLNVKVVVMPKGTDPDSYRQKKGLVALAKRLRNYQMSVLCFKLMYLHNVVLPKSNPSDRPQYLASAVKMVHMLSHGNLARYYLSEVASMFGVPFSLIESYGGKRQVSTKDQNRLAYLRVALMKSVVTNGSAFRWSIVHHLNFYQPAFQQLYLKWIEYVNSHKQHRMEEIRLDHTDREILRAMRNVKAIDNPIVMYTFAQTVKALSNK